jgi:hypothetical protein
MSLSAEDAREQHRVFDKLKSGKPNPLERDVYPEEIDLGTDVLSVKEFEALTIKDICVRYNNIPAFLAIIKSQKIVTENEIKMNALKESRGELISRDLLKMVFGLIDLMNKRLLECPLSFVSHIADLLKADQVSAVKESEQIITKLISKIISGSKNEIMKQLKEPQNDKTLGE